MFKCYTLILSILSIISIHLQAQTRPYVTIGAGYPDAILVGLSVPTGTCALGLAFGGAEDLTTFRADIAYHFAGRAGEGSLKPWFLRMPVVFSRSKKDHETGSDRSLRTGLRFGYAWFPVPRIGVSLEAGMGYILYDEYKDRMFSDGGSRYEPSCNLTISTRL